MSERNTPFESDEDEALQRRLRRYFEDESWRGTAPGDLWQRIAPRLGTQDEIGSVRDAPGERGGGGPLRWFIGSVAVAAGLLVAVFATGALLLFLSGGGPVPASEDGGIQETPVQPTSSSSGRPVPSSGVTSSSAPTSGSSSVPQATAYPMSTSSGQPNTQPTSSGSTPSPSENVPASPSWLGSRPQSTTFANYGRQPFVDAVYDSVSTFSLDVDRTSFQLAHRWVQSGFPVEPDSVRAEEWVNAFSYNYDPPAGDDRFGISSAFMPHPLDEGTFIGRIAFQAPLFEDDAPVNVTLVLDASGSMADGNRVDIARAAAEAIRKSLGPDDRIAVVHFTDSVIWDLTVEHTDRNDRAAINSIAALQPHQSTNVQEGLNVGVELAEIARRERPDAHNYIILMSDGVANVDATDPFAILAGKPDDPAGNPLRLVTIGVGVDNYNDLLLEQLAQNGNGWYRYLDDVDEARATFTRENWLALSTPFADQTRAQVRWDEDAVISWRIIGYENRVTSDEAFFEDRTEFAEIYAGTATTVFYELVLRRVDPSISLGSVSVRWVEPGSGAGRIQDAQLAGANSTGETVRRQFERTIASDARLAFGAIVALTADRYSAYGDAGLYGADVARLKELAPLLQPHLGHLQAFRDFRDVLNSLPASYDTAQDSSGYNR